MLGNSSMKLSKDLPVGSNLEERGRSALESGLWADCKFLVGEGEGKQEIEACKIMLAIASPVFANMFFGSLAEQGYVEVPDVQPDVFKKLLRFIYTHKLDVQSSEEALQVIPAAHKYMMPDLIEKCIPVLKNSLSTDNMKQFYEVMNIADFYNIEELKEMTIKEVQEKAESALKSPEFVNLHSDVLVNLLRQGHMNVMSEVEVINAVIRWATARCEDNEGRKKEGKKKGGKKIVLPVNGSSLRKILKESQILKQLRFLTLSEKELESGPISAGILTEEEICGLKAYIHSGGNIPIPDSLCPLDRLRKSRLCHDGWSTRVRMSKWLQTVEGPHLETERFEVVDYARPFVLLSITIPTQVTEDSSKNLLSDSYEEYVEIKVSKSYNCVRLPNESKRQKLDYYAQGSFKGRVKYRDEITIPLEVTPYSEESVINNKSDRFEVFITFHVSGIYPKFVTAYAKDIECLDKLGHTLAFNYRN